MPEWRNSSALRVGVHEVQTSGVRGTGICPPTLLSTLYILQNIADDYKAELRCRLSTRHFRFALATLSPFRVLHEYYHCPISLGILRRY
jgi:hypothetical protein